MVDWILFATGWSSGVEQWVPDAWQVGVPRVAVERSLSLLSDAYCLTDPSSLLVRLPPDYFGVIPVNQMVRLSCVVGQCRLVEGVFRGFTLRSGVNGLGCLSNVLFMLLYSDTQLSPGLTNIRFRALFAGDLIHCFYSVHERAFVLRAYQTLSECQSRFHSSLYVVFLQDASK